MSISQYFLSQFTSSLFRRVSVSPYILCGMRPAKQINCIYMKQIGMMYTNLDEAAIFKAEILALYTLFAFLQLLIEGAIEMKRNQNDFSSR